MEIGGKRKRSFAMMAFQMLSEEISSSDDRRY
jgi:hypothetical protein